MRYYLTVQFCVLYFYFGFWSVTVLVAPFTFRGQIIVLGVAVVPGSSPQGLLVPGVVVCLASLSRVQTYGVLSARVALQRRL